MEKCRVCWSCKHFSFDGGEKDWSEDTPGYTGRMSCGKGVYDFSLQDVDEDVLRESLMKAEACEKFEDRKS